MSSSHLSMTVTFLTGRYHGEEWPPSSARLFQALVAGVMTCGYRSYEADLERALGWLEAQSPPRISTCPVSEGVTYRIAVPNNDMDVVAWEWLSGRSDDPARIKAMKQVHPRQLLTAGPHVQYAWEVDPAEAAAMEQPLRTAVHCFHTLGWGVDMAFADLGAPAGLAEAYEPSLSGQLMATPMPGTLADLRNAYRRFTQRTSGTGVDTHTRPSLFRMQGYTRAGEADRPSARFVLLKPGSEEVKPVAWENCMKVAGWLRHAAAERLKAEYPREFIESYVQGHPEQGDPGHRLSYVPLPSIYSYGDGLIRRALILEPPNTAGDVARMLQLKLTGEILQASDEREQCWLGPGGDNDWTFERYLPRSPRARWRTVTPVILPGYNTSGPGKLSITKTENLLLRSFEMAGYPESTIEALCFQAGPWWPGTKHAAAIRVPVHLQRFPRIHVEVRFRAGVRGAVLAGIGRHYGIGLFAHID